MASRQIVDRINRLAADLKTHEDEHITPTISGSLGYKMLGVGRFVEVQNQQVGVFTRGFAFDGPQDVLGNLTVDYLDVHNRTITTAIDSYVLYADRASVFHTEELSLFVVAQALGHTIIQSSLETDIFDRPVEDDELTFLESFVRDAANTTAIFRPMGSVNMPESGIDVVYMDLPLRAV